MFDALQWHWEYEPDLQAGFVIPDFLLPSFAHAVVIECKPALTVPELAEHRESLIGKLGTWLHDDVLREIRELDQDPDASVELTDAALNDLVRVACRRNPQGRSRRVLVVGPYLQLHDARVTVDGVYGFCVCCDHGTPVHVGLSEAIGGHCLLCGQLTTSWADPSTIMLAWRESQNKVQWRPT